MPEPLRRLAVASHLVAETTIEALERLAAARERLGVELLLPAAEAAKHPRLVGKGFIAADDDQVAAADACIVFGGDGSILRAFAKLLASNVPVIGVNFGTVGFLADICAEGWLESLAQVVRGSYSVVELLTVEAQFDGQRRIGVNDVVLTRCEPHGVLHLDYSISGTPIGSMRCDGMIVASPAGSTAYNLSCGGPVVVWDARVLVVNFVAPHSLGFRPLVLRPDHVVMVRNDSRHVPADIMIDGEVVGDLGPGEYISIAASPLRARLLVRDAGSFYRNVEVKLFGGVPAAC